MTKGIARLRRHPNGPTDLRWRSWWGVLRRTVVEFLGDTIMDWAAALTYYSVLSIFPAIVVLTALLGMLGPDSTKSLIEAVHGMGPGSETGLLVSAITELQRSRTLAGPMAIIGLAVSLWMASTYIGAFMRAANAIYGTAEGRPIWKRLPLRVALTVTMVLLLATCTIAMVATGAVADRLARWLHIGRAGVMTWEIAKWPVLMVMVGLAIALLYWAAPNARQLGFRWISPGSALAVLLWVAASAGFAFYVANFGTYNKTYGSLAAVIVFLVWLWISNIAVLLGIQFDVELARARSIEQGDPPDRQPVLEPREPPESETKPTVA